MTSRIVRQDFNGLNRLVKAISDGDVLRVGVLGKKNTRGEAGGLKKGGGHSTKSVKRGWTAEMSNADIGAVMEFGSISKGIPDRPWLRLPLIHEAGTIIKAASEGIKDMVNTGNKKGMLKRLGIACEAAIQRGFASRGFGTWKPNAPYTIQQKGSDSPLIDTAQLRRSVASEVGPPR